MINHIILDTQMILIREFRNMFKVKVVVKKDDSGKYDPSNEIKAVKSVNDGDTQVGHPPVGFTAPATAAAATPATAGVPPWLQPK